MDETRIMPLSFQNISSFVFFLRKTSAVSALKGLSALKVHSKLKGGFLFLEGGFENNISDWLEISHVFVFSNRQ